MPLDLEIAAESSPGTQLNLWMEEYCRQKREEARQELEALLQSKIESIESQFKGPKQKRTKHFQTPFGTIKLVRRAYLEKGHYTCKVDALLGLPAKGWFSSAEKLACALGVSLEFAHAARILEETTGIEISDHGLANRVEQIGEGLHEELKLTPPEDVYPLDSALHNTVRGQQQGRLRCYVGMDGIMVPLNQGQGYKEAKVGVVFWQHSHLAVSKKRREVRSKKYCATLESREVFSELLFKCFASTVKEHPCEVVVLGDGARWIWDMASEYYPQAIQTLDFHHVSEYVWEVARELHQDALESQQEWVQTQLQRLKDSRWKDVIEALRFLRGSPALKVAVDKLKRYLQNNSERIDYKRYLEMGLMIGSGVVESSNRRVVTQRLKQAGMHWSQRGANAVMSLRAAYLSDSDSFEEVFKRRTA